MSGRIRTGTRPHRSRNSAQTLSGEMRHYTGPVEASATDGDGGKTIFQRPKLKSQLAPTRTTSASPK
jgi:hypothetical protein